MVDTNKCDWDVNVRELGCLWYKHSACYLSVSVLLCLAYSSLTSHSHFTNFDSEFAPANHKVK